MSWSKYAEFLAFAVVLVVIPGPDFAVVTKNTLVGGHRRGRWTALPQFLTPGAGLGWLLVLAWSHAVMSLAYLLVLVTGLHSARRVLMRRQVRRALDATTGAVLLGFGARLATEHV
jgi:threonine/homoserine/homoserine lactone efflux protein